MREKYRELAKKLNINYIENYSLPIKIKKYEFKSGINIGIFPGNFKKAEHRWPENKFIELTNLIQKKYQFNIIYISDTKESKIVQKNILSRLENIKLIKTKDIYDLCNILINTNLLITNNTGPLHVADLLNTPTLSINSGYSYKIWAPKSNIHFHVYSNNWKTCRDIPVEKVFSEFEIAIKKLNLTL